MKFNKKEFKQIQKEYSVNKFGKNRSVDSLYLNVPIKYIVNTEEFNGANEGMDKTLCIVDFYGKNKALVAWRNNEKCKMGMTHICPIIYKNKNYYIVYRGREILISDDSGWVW